jgi:mono/diheme cytochrome c family protein
MTLLRFSPLHALAALTLLTAPLGQALAQNATNGQVLYNQVLVSGRNSCAASACHGSAPSRRLNKIQNGASAAVIQSAIGGVGTMNFLSGHLTDTQLNDLAAYIASATGGTPSYLAVATAPVATLSATGLAFGAVSVGTAAPVGSVTLSNTGTAVLNITSLTSSNAVFALTHDCPATLAVSAQCTLSVGFTPVAATSYSGTLSIATNAGTRTVTLSGSGTAAPVGLLAWSGSPSLAFAATPLGTASAAQTLTLRNTGSASATLTALATGGADAADFLLAGSCGAGTVMPAQGSCTVTVTFDPTLAGNRLATLTVSASGATNPPAVTLAGTGTAAPASTSGASATTTTTTPATGTDSNVGGGGCSIAPPGPRSGSGIDPLLALLTALAAVALRLRHRRTHRSHPTRQEETR